jgi:hypothetical protein
MLICELATDLNIQMQVEHWVEHLQPVTEAIVNLPATLNHCIITSSSRAAQSCADGVEAVGPASFEVAPRGSVHVELHQEVQVMPGKKITTIS